jgi:copper homeostasis protein CutC
MILDSAVDAGADRLEICANLAAGGGVTPSIGLVKCIASQCPGIPLMVSAIYFSLAINLVRYSTNRS